MIKSMVPAITESSRICVVCFRPANCYNFGVISCDACKMFFKRTTTLNITYTCKRDNKCYEKNFSCLENAYCRACRMVQCLRVGMKLSVSPVLEVKNKRDYAVINLIENLLYQDSKREKVLISNFTFENPTLLDLVENRKLTIVARDPNYQLTSSDWCFFGAFTAVKFLLSLHFMKELSISDKMNLLENFTAKATLLFSAIRSMRAKNDKMIKPDGNDFFVEFLSKWSNFSKQFTNRVRSQLVSRLTELAITNEEFILITVIFFCNPALSKLTKPARTILDTHQKTYTDALMKYCLNNYQHTGPARFTDLLSLCTVTNQCFEDVQYLYWLFQYHFHVHYKKLVASVI